MKKNKLLVPLLGLTSVATLVAPIATSCTSEQKTVDHIKSSPIVEKNGLGGEAVYLLVLDAHDYDVHGFRVTTTVHEKDTTGAKDSDFETTWLVDGDHLMVYVKIVDLEDIKTRVQEYSKIRLNLNVNYGSQWSKSLEVYFTYSSSEYIGIPLTHYTYSYTDPDTGEKSIKHGYTTKDMPFSKKTTYDFYFTLEDLPQGIPLSMMKILKSSGGDGAKICVEKFLVNGEVKGTWKTGDYYEWTEFDEPIKAAIAGASRDSIITFRVSILGNCSGYLKFAETLPK